LDTVGLALNPALAYSVLDAAVSERRIRLNVSQFEPYESYCAILDPIWDDLNAAYLCSTNDGSGGWRNSNCAAMCVCTADACTTYDYPPDVKFDAALTGGGDELSGTIILSADSGPERMNVRLVRQ
jgi:hypothetical protein